MSERPRPPPEVARHFRGFVTIDFPGAHVPRGGGEPRQPWIDGKPYGAEPPPASRRRA